MLEQSQKLTDGLIIYSARLSDCERLDFKNDALAGVRANFFNSSCKTQSDTTKVVINGLTCSLAYSMKQNKPLAWKATRNHVPYQTVKRIDNGVYSVITYGRGGTVCKRQFFNSLHMWLKTEYYDTGDSSKLLTLVRPKSVCGVTAVEVEDYDADGKAVRQVLFPSDKMPGSPVRILIYSNRGMLWYDRSLAPEGLPQSTENNGECSQGGFKFSRKRLESSDNGKSTDLLSLDACEYLTDGLLSEDNSKTDDAESENPAEKDDTYSAKYDAYSAYDIIEKILRNVSKDNENLLGESEENSDYVGAHFENADSVEVTENDEKAAPADLPPCNLVVLTKSGRYTYYGELDNNNCRTGRGRTVSPDGLTSYDGEYVSDMRSGFGVCYYKNGSINYVGDWSDNTRSGRGVGYRQSDGTMHAGTWQNNLPDGVGARFDGSGNFIDVCSYSGGKRSGKSVSFDKDGNIVVAIYENGEKISEHTIDDEVLNSKWT